MDSFIQAMTCKVPYPMAMKASAARLWLPWVAALCSPPGLHTEWSRTFNDHHTGTQCKQSQQRQAGGEDSVHTHQRVLVVGRLVFPGFLTIPEARHLPALLLSAWHHSCPYTSSSSLPAISSPPHTAPSDTHTLSSPLIPPLLTDRAAGQWGASLAQGGAGLATEFGCSADDSVKQDCYLKAQYTEKCCSVLDGYRSGI